MPPVRTCSNEDSLRRSIVKCRPTTLRRAFSAAVPILCSSINNICLGRRTPQTLPPVPTSHSQRKPVQVGSELRSVTPGRTVRGGGGRGAAYLPGLTCGTLKSPTPTPTSTYPNLHDEKPLALSVNLRQYPKRNYPMKSRATPMPFKCVPNGPEENVTHILVAYLFPNCPPCSNGYVDYLYTSFGSAIEINLIPG